ncbi:MAG: helix-turn-helix transcriptional regulator [Spirochaetales bacterium]|nr:helix-turn-helix transcriptional regulator [Spirochaetales bacterium]
MFTAEYRKVIDLLIQARTDAGLSQAEVAGRIGWRQDYVSKVEAGQRRLDVVELARFARAYGKPLRFFTRHLEP